MPGTLCPHTAEQRGCTGGGGGIAHCGTGRVSARGYCAHQHTIIRPWVGQMDRGHQVRPCRSSGAGMGPDGAGNTRGSGQDGGRRPPARGRCACHKPHKRAQLLQKWDSRKAALALVCRATAHFTADTGHATSGTHRQPINPAAVQAGAACASMCEGTHPSQRQEAHGGRAHRVAGGVVHRRHEVVRHRVSAASFVDERP